MQNEKVQEAITLLDELIGAESSRFFYGINPGTWAKLKTIRATLAARKEDSHAG